MANQAPNYGLNDQQLEFLETRFNQFWQNGWQATKQMRLVMAIEIHAEHLITQIGRWWAARERLEEGVEQASTRKTPEQIAMLEQVFFNGGRGMRASVVAMGGQGPYPDQGGCRDLAVMSGLSYKQIKSWMENQRKKALDSGRLVIWHDNDYIFSRPTHYQFNW